MDSERWQRVARVFDSVLERPPEERDAFLTSACGADVELRREIESLLAQDGTTTLIDQPMLETASAVLADRDLDRGTQLGPYRIDALVGSGGMGQVYRATDTRLNRLVAIKVLAKTLAADSAFRARFDREALTIASLSHPHLCTVHDVGSQDGVAFLVMEYVEGETLAARLDKGPLPLEQALKCGGEIADALATAHQRGIIHRDLKPSNIILTRGGAKLLDFGLAKPTAPLGMGAATATAFRQGLTGQGTILGTLQYMAPEQLEGKEADARTDIFAFGAVLYEMLTGRKAFEGKSQASLIGAIMHVDPPALPAAQMTPLAIDRLVRACLAKNPDDRWQSASDLRRALRWAHDSPVEATAVRRRNRARLPWTIAALLGIGVVATTVREIGSPAVNPRVARFAVAAPAGTALPASAPFAPEISPDGTRLVFHIVRGGERMLAERSIDALEARALAGTEGGTFPFWSPDGRVMAFFADGKLKKINAAGGPIQVICDAPSGLGGTWNREGIIVFLAAGDLYTVAATGGQPTPLTALRQEARFHNRPRFLPDGRRFLYFVEPDAIYLASLDGSEPTRLPARANAAVYAPPGYLVLRQERTLFAQRFDSDLRTPLGDPIMVAEEVVGGSVGGVARGAASFSVSESGVLAYARAPDTVRTLTWFDRAGRPLGTIESLPSTGFGGVELSPDGTRLAMNSPAVGADANIWLFDIEGRRPTQLTFAEGSDRHPIWSPDGRRLVFASMRPDTPGMYLKPAGGEHPEELLLRSQSTLRDEHWPLDWSSKGIVYASGPDPDSDDLWMLPIDGDRKPYPLVREPGQQDEARVSPNGRWLAYTDLAGPRPEVFVQSLVTTGAKWRVSTAGGRWPHWRGDGRELFILSADGSLVAVPIDPEGSAFRQDAAETLFQTGQSVVGGGQGAYSVSSDGQRFLITTAGDQDRPVSVVVVTNWQSAVK